MKDDMLLTLKKKKKNEKDDILLTLWERGYSMTKMRKILQITCIGKINKK